MSRDPEPVRREGDRRSRQSLALSRICPAPAPSPPSRPVSDSVTPSPCPPPAQAVTTPTPPPPCTHEGTPPPLYYYILPYFLALVTGVWDARAVCCGCVTIVTTLWLYVYAGRCAARLGPPASLRSLGRCFGFVPQPRVLFLRDRAGGVPSPTIRASSLRVPV